LVFAGKGVQISVFGFRNTIAFWGSGTAIRKDLCIYYTLLTLAFVINCYQTNCQMHLKDDCFCPAFVRIGILISKGELKLPYNSKVEECDATTIKLYSKSLANNN
jgi:hypothetical protein